MANGLQYVALRTGALAGADCGAPDRITARQQNVTRARPERIARFISNDVLTVRYAPQAGSAPLTLGVSVLGPRHTVLAWEAMRPPRLITNAPTCARDAATIRSGMSGA